MKFQAFSADRLVARDAAACDYQRGHTVAATQHEMLRRLELNRDAFARLKREAEALNIEFLATPFGVNELEMLVELGVPAIKLASTDITNTPLLEAAAKSGVPLIAATGAADMQEVRAAMSILSAAPAVALLHCVSKYPTPLAEANLAAIAALRREFDVAVGYSDHTPDVYTAGLAVAAGATVLEKHLTLDRSSAGPDHFFSLTPEDFPAYVAAAREAAAALGTGQVACDANQLEVRRLTRRSIIARAPIARGMPVVGTLLDTQRPGGGIDPIHWNRVIGRVAAADIPAGARIEWDMLAAD